MSDLVSEFHLTLLPEGQIATKNNKGMQMSVINPLFEEWVAAYDGKLAIGDLGCAYGINSLAAAKRRVPVVAMDMDDAHLVRVSFLAPSYPLLAR
jgi:tRNA1(Val) A37 N6-methylase TrmN6